MALKLVAGNWKMHGLSADLAEIQAIADRRANIRRSTSRFGVPATLIERAARAVPGFAIGGQDVHQAEKGAHTGCISAAMLLDAGAVLTIVGHCERREAQGESDAEVKAKAEAALSGGLGVILCVGESLEVREAGEAVGTVAAQLDASLPRDHASAKLAVAYEPIWAIGTGRIHRRPGHRRNACGAWAPAWSPRYGDRRRGPRILYGGSVKASNAAEIFACRTSTELWSAGRASRPPTSCRSSSAAPSA